ncbi:MAG TPA: tetratricopeptide repeat protein [Pirellulales bacterium]|nr:tetratricopeptide repeat protein [Pirellulales bacterium]
MNRRWLRIVSLLALTTGLVWLARPLARGAMLRLDLHRARDALAEKRLDQAITWLEAAEGRRPDEVEAQYLLGVANRRLGRYYIAKEKFAIAERLGWPKKDLERQRNLMLFQMGYLREAELYLIGLLETDVADDDAAEIYDALAAGYLAEFRIFEAMACLDHWLAWQPRSIPAHQSRAEVMLSLNRNGDYQAELREILKIDPSRIAERLALAQWLSDETQVDEALAECELCRRQAPDDARVHLIMGLVIHRKGLMAEAKRELETAISKPLDPRNRTQALITLGQIAAEARDYESAALRYREAARLTPETPTAPYALGTVLETLGRHEEAEREIDRSRVLQEQFEEMQDIRRDLLQDTSNAALRVKAAKILLDQGDKTGAANWMLSALHSDPDLREAHEMLADYFEEKERSDLAQHHRDAARRVAASEDSGDTSRGRQ